MNLRISKKQLTYLSFIIIVICIFFVMMQFLIIQPLKERKVQAEEALIIEKKLLETVEKERSSHVQQGKNSFELQKQVPVEPLYDQLLAELEEAKTVSNTIIESYEVVTEEDTDKTSTNVEELELNFKQDTETSKEAEAKLTASLENATISVLVHADNYEEMTTFIKTLEASDRIVIVDELTYIEEENQDYFSFQLTFSAFYASGLDDLKNESPRIDVEEPSNKKNPLIK
ncbi:hypothetical protein [Bacillus sp. FJAT-47783]|uniref:hypothetical protein n=1 Tax=Bacillus sp. FJAT-47783 TaxID=2922712 RepID=UPI001FAE1686|nr:hypothetical protein [Bacillus sp. FJAT-47783]